MNGTTLKLACSWNLAAASAAVPDTEAGLSVARWIHREAELPRTVGSTHTIVVPRAAFDCTRFIGHRAERLCGRAGEVGFVSAGDYGAWEFRLPIDVVHIYVPPEMMARAVEDSGAVKIGVEEMPFRAALEDPLAKALAIEASRAIDPLPPTRLYVDQMVRALALRLVDLHGRRVERLAARGGLAPWQIRRVQEFLAAHLAEDVSLTEIASLAGLSTFHFARAFKASVGVPPHAYQRGLRIARARELLADPSLSVIDVALSVGFDSPQAFARTFRRETGATPTEFRREKLY